MRRRWAAGLIAGLCLISGGAAAQTYTTTLTPSADAPKIGNVVRGLSNTVFTINATSGVVTQSGPGIRLTPGTVTTPTITIRCMGGTCNNRRIAVLITRDGAAPAEYTNFTVGGLSCSAGCSAAFIGLPPAGGMPLSFEIGGVKNGTTATFRLGSDVTVSGGVTGTKTFGVTVAASVGSMGS